MSQLQQDKPKDPRDPHRLSKESVVSTAVMELGRDSLQKTKRGLKFWLIFLAIAVALYEAAFEMCAVGIGLPSIAQDLNVEDFVWVGSAYALSSSCALPMTGGLAQARKAFGRRDVMVASLVTFAVGAAICGSSQSMNQLIAGRVVQGLGGGGILSLPSIILSDLVPLSERGTYNGLLGVTWSVAIVTSAVIGGALSDAGQWRWIFYMNLPITAVSLALVLAFVRVPAPKGSVRQKLAQIDWIGNFIIIVSTCLCCISLTWAGVKYAWTSTQVLVPLCIGLAGMVGFRYYETKTPSPLIPFRLLTNRTSVTGYIATFLNALFAISAICVMKTTSRSTYKLVEETRRPVQVVLTGWDSRSRLFGIVAGISVAVLKRYKPTILLGWALAIVGLGMWTTLTVDSPTSAIIGYQVIFGVGIGALYTTTYFPVLAPLPVEANARALAFFNFNRSFAQVWGVTIGASVLQNQLLQKLPAEFVARLPQGVAVAYTAIPNIERLPEPLRSAVRDAFAESVRIVWVVILCLACVGMASMVFMKEVKMHEYTDEDWGIEQPRLDAEHANSATKLGSINGSARGA